MQCPDVRLLWLIFIILHFTVYVNRVSRDKSFPLESDRSMRIPGQRRGLVLAELFRRKKTAASRRTLRAVRIGPLIYPRPTVMIAISPNMMPKSWTFFNFSPKNILPETAERITIDPLLTGKNITPGMTPESERLSL